MHLNQFRRETPSILALLPNGHHNAACRWCGSLQVFGIRSLWVELGLIGILHDLSPSLATPDRPVKLQREKRSSLNVWSIHFKKAASAMIDRGRGYIRIYPYEIVKNKNTGVQNGLALNSQTERKINGKHNAWIDGLIPEDDGIHKCINIEIQFWGQIEYFILLDFPFTKGKKEKHCL